MNNEEKTPGQALHDCLMQNGVLKKLPDWDKLTLEFKSKLESAAKLVRFKALNDPVVTKMHHLLKCCSAGRSTAQRQYTRMILKTYEKALEQLQSANCWAGMKEHLFIAACEVKDEQGNPMVRFEPMEPKGEWTNAKFDIGQEEGPKYIHLGSKIYVQVCDSGQIQIQPEDRLFTAIVKQPNLN